MRLLPKLAPIPMLDGDRPVPRPAVSQAELYGCPAKFLWLTEDDYSSPESFKIHTSLRDFQIKHVNDTVETLTAKSQLDSVPAMLDALFKERGQLIVINSFPGLEDGVRFLWHLACAAGSMRLKDVFNKKSFAFSYVGTMRVEDDAYQVQPRQVLAYGPCVDEFDRERISDTVEFLVRFTDFTRILLMSTAGISELLQKFRVVPADVAYFYNLSQRTKEVKKKPRKKNEVSV